MEYAVVFGAEAPLPSDCDSTAIEQAVVAALGRANSPRGAEVSITLVDDAAMQVLNRDYRGVDATTDVLAFSALEGDAFILPDDAPLSLGDIVISVETAARQAQTMGHGICEELALLAIHGSLHLVGLDHGTEDEQAAMWQVQDEVLAMLGYSLRSYEPSEGAEEAQGE